MKNKTIGSIKEQELERDVEYTFKCVYCGKEIEDFTFEHQDEEWGAEITEVWIEGVNTNELIAWHNQCRAVSFIDSDYFLEEFG